MLIEPHAVLMPCHWGGPGICYKCGYWDHLSGETIQRPHVEQIKDYLPGEYEWQQRIRTGEDPEPVFKEITDADL